MRKCQCGGKMRLCIEVVEKVAYYPTIPVEGGYKQGKVAVVKNSGWGCDGGHFAYVCVKCKYRQDVREDDIDPEDQSLPYDGDGTDWMLKVVSSGLSG
jgi:hypothetical protein